MCSFRHSYVLTRKVKALAWCAVLLINIFFVYFTLLRGLERGLDWQRSFLFACIIQIVVEITFYETSECALVNFFIPDLARNEVRTVNFALHLAIQRVCTAIVTSNDVLDAPRYLFLSTNLARKFPNLLESAIVQAYHTYSPGMIGQDWKFLQASSFASYSPWARSRARMRRFTVAAVLVAIFQRLGAASPAGQRLLIHSMQPIVMSGITYMWVFLYHRPVYFAFLGVFGLIAGAYQINKKVNECSVHSSNVFPGSEDVVQKPVADETTPSDMDAHIQDVRKGEYKHEELHVALPPITSSRDHVRDEADISSDDLDERIAMSLIHGKDFLWVSSDEDDEESIQFPYSFPFDNFLEEMNSESDSSGSSSSYGNYSSESDTPFDCEDNGFNVYDKHSDDESCDMNARDSDKVNYHKDVDSIVGSDLCVEVRSAEGSAELG